MSIFEAAAQQDSNYHDNDYDESADYPLAIHSYGPKLEGGKQPKGKIVKTKSKQGRRHLPATRPVIQHHIPHAQSLSTASGLGNRVDTDELDISRVKTPSTLQRRGEEPQASMGRL